MNQAPTVQEQSDLTEIFDEQMDISSVGDVDQVSPHGSAILNGADDLQRLASDAVPPNAFHLFVQACPNLFSDGLTSISNDAAESEHLCSSASDEDHMQTFDPLETQAQELNHLMLADTTTQAEVMADNDPTVDSFFTAVLSELAEEVATEDLAEDVVSGEDAGSDDSDSSDGIVFDMNPPNGRAAHPTAADPNLQQGQRRQTFRRSHRAGHLYGDLTAEEEDYLAGSLSTYAEEDEDEADGSGEPKRCSANRLFRALQDLGVATKPHLTGKKVEKKHVPPIYLENSLEVRLRVLAGFIDSDGTYDWHGGCMSFSQVRDPHERLFWDMVNLARSCGFLVNTHVRNVVTPVSKQLSPQLVAVLWGEFDSIPCLLGRKQARPRRTTRKIEHLMIKSIKLQEKRSDWFGFKVDGDQMYLRSDYLVLHNSGFEESMKFKRLTNAQRYETTLLSRSRTLTSIQIGAIADSK